MLLSNPPYDCDPRRDCGCVETKPLAVLLDVEGAPVSYALIPAPEPSSPYSVPIPMSIPKVSDATVAAEAARDIDSDRARACDAERIAAAAAAAAAVVLLGPPAAKAPGLDAEEGVNASTPALSPPPALLPGEGAANDQALLPLPPATAPPGVEPGVDTCSCCGCGMSTSLAVTLAPPAAAAPIPLLPPLPRPALIAPLTLGAIDRRSDGYRPALGSTVGSCMAAAAVPAAPLAEAELEGTAVETLRPVIAAPAPLVGPAAPVGPAASVEGACRPPPRFCRADIEAGGLGG